MTIIKTERLCLRHFQPFDIPEMASISADKTVMKYFPEIQTLAETTQMVNRIVEHQLLYGYSLYAVETGDNNHFIGFIGLIQPSFNIPHFTPKHLPIVEIGWRLSSSYWGQGLATEGAKAVLNYAFTEIGLKEVISFTAKINTPSIRVMEKIGLQHDCNDDFLHPNLEETDKLRPHVLYRGAHLI